MRPQENPHASSSMGDSILVSVSNLLLAEIDTSKSPNLKIEIYHSSCLDSSLFPIIRYWGFDTTGKFSEHEKVFIRGFLNNICDSLVLDKSQLTKSFINRNQLHSEETRSINISKMLFSDSMKEAYSIIGIYYKYGNDSMIKGGWEEIIICKQINSKWNISKRLKIIEY
ncbi:MAG: hypothetical protein NTY96_10530 [Bacteroidetes bacterium]|nr:hypothetical protein [Bacteroidota bacterium]